MTTTFEERIIKPVVFRNDIIHEDMEFYPVGMVFEEDCEDLITKYGLNSKYRDVILITKEDYDKSYPDIDTFTIYDGKYVPAISIRAMHRILFNDISINSLHFLANESLRRALLEYDGRHGRFFRYIIAKQEYPKNIFTLSININNSDDTAIALVDYMETVTSITGEAGLLVYAHNIDNGNNYTIYVDGNISPVMELRFMNTKVEADPDNDEGPVNDTEEPTEVTDDGSGTV